MIKNSTITITANRCEEMIKYIYREFLQNGNKNYIYFDYTTFLLKIISEYYYDQNKKYPEQIAISELIDHSNTEDEMSIKMILAELKRLKLIKEFQIENRPNNNPQVIKHIVVIINFYPKDNTLCKFFDLFIAENNKDGDQLFGLSLQKSKIASYINSKYQYFQNKKLTLLINDEHNTDWFKCFFEKDDENYIKIMRTLRGFEDDKLLKITNVQYININGYIQPASVYLTIKNINKIKTLIKQEEVKNDTLKINIIINKENGIFVKDKIKTNNYPIRKGKRLNIIHSLKDGGKDGNFLCEFINYSSIKNLSKEINNINKLFKKNLIVNDNLITHIDTGGYKLNNKNFNITFD